jgi:transketolase
MGLGIAMALKMNQSPAKVYVMLGDGELEEGTVWEAAMMATAKNVNNIVAILDCNKIQKMDHVNNVIGDPAWEEKWQSFGWSTYKVIDGHNIDEFKEAILNTSRSEKPRLIISHTIKGKGVSLMEDNPNWHFRLPGKKELKIFKEELEIDDKELE